MFSMFNTAGVNCLEGSRGNSPKFLQIVTFKLIIFLPVHKDGSSSSPTPHPCENIPLIPLWGSPASGKRDETEPVAKFHISTSLHYAEVVFNPPMYNPFALTGLTSEPAVSSS